MKTASPSAFRQDLQNLFKFFAVPLLVAIVLAPVVLYLIGGQDLVRFAVYQLSWRVALRITGAILVFALLTWIKHVAWYRDEPPPIWWRHSMWLNILEFAVLLALILFAIWAIPRFASTHATM